VTAQHTDLQSRVRNLQRSEAQYLELVAKAQSVGEIIQVSGKIDEVRGQIEQNQGRLSLLNDQTTFATVRVSLSVPGPSADSKIPGPIEVLNEAVQSSLIAAIVVLDGAMILLVAGLWFVPLGLAALFCWRVLGRRMRLLYAKLISW
jgi:hypothetical protein